MNIQSDIYRLVTDTIIELLEQSLKTKSYWTNVKGADAHNATTKRTYTGLNQLLLCFASNRKKFAKNSWLTFKQMQEHGGKIKQGSKSQIIVFNDFLYFDKAGKKIKYEDFKNLSAMQKAECKKVYFLKHYNVFNVEQVKNLPADFYIVPEIQQLTEPEKDEASENLLNCSGAVINYVGNRAFYSMFTDEITLPPRQQFTGTVPFYSVAFHELGHWTGHQTRLNRELGNKFGSDKYAKEELIAELTSAFICASLGFSETITDNAAYIQSWLTALKNDKRFIIQASSAATRAAEYITELSQKSLAA